MINVQMYMSGNVNFGKYIWEPKSAKSPNMHSTAAGYY